MNQERKIEVSMQAMDELEVLLRKLASASKEDLSLLHDEGLQEAAEVFADVIEAALEEERETGS